MKVCFLGSKMGQTKRKPFRARDFLRFFARNWSLHLERIFLKGNPNFRGMLNWIIQILHYYCRKQHKNSENSQIIEQNVAISLSLLFSLLTATCASFALPNGSVFSALGHSFERHKWSFVLYIVSCSALKVAFSKLTLAKYHSLHKKTIRISCLQLLVNVFTNLSLL